MANQTKFRVSRQTGYGTQAGAAREQGDADGDGDVDGGDFLIWQSNYGASGSDASAGTAVPEPSTTLLASILLICGATQNRTLARHTGVWSGLTF